MKNAITIIVILMLIQLCCMYIVDIADQYHKELQACQAKQEVKQDIATTSVITEVAECEEQGGEAHLYSYQNINKNTFEIVHEFECKKPEGLIHQFTF